MTRKAGGTDTRGSAAGSGRRGRMRNSFSSCGSDGSGRRIFLARFGELGNLADLPMSSSLVPRTTVGKEYLHTPSPGCYKLYPSVTNCARLLLTVTICTRLLPTVSKRLSKATNTAKTHIVEHKGMADTR